MTMNMLFAGFGGQGILFAGKVAAYTGLLDEKQVTWLPSYGPEMRGGTANCSVCLSEETIGSPLVVNPNLLLAMNGPSYHRFIQTVQKDGITVFDSSLITDAVYQKETHQYGIPATKMADDNQLKGLANMICLGYVLQLTGFTSTESLESAIEHTVPAKKAYLLEKNKQAFLLGYNYQGKELSK